MKYIHYFVLLFVVLAIGCAPGAKQKAATDMELANLGFEALSQGKYGDAESYLDKALAANPNNPYALLNLGVICQNTKRFKKARRLYEKVIQLNPTVIVDRSNEPGKAGKTLVDLARENLQRLP